MATARTTTASRSARQEAVKEHKRRLILDAAQRVFAEVGLERASIRAIAEAAGYTAGAIYFHYPSKEAIYGDVLAESVGRLHDAVRAGVASAGDQPLERVRRGALAVFDFYAANPRDLDLGFYLFNGMRPRGLTRELNVRLNRSLTAALNEIESAMLAAGSPPEQATRENVALFSHTVGLLLMLHTGRSRLFPVTPRVLLQDYLDNLIQRLAKIR